MKKYLMQYSSTLSSSKWSGTEIANSGSQVVEADNDRQAILRALSSFPPDNAVRVSVKRGQKGNGNYILDVALSPRSKTRKYSFTLYRQGRWGRFIQIKKISINTDSDKEAILWALDTEVLSDYKISNKELYCSNMVSSWGVMMSVNVGSSTRSVRCIDKDFAH